MPYDVVAANRQAVQSGLALGQAMFNNSLRMQQLQSEQAMRRLQEAHVAQQMKYAMEAHDLQVQERADMEKAMARVQLETMPEPTLPTQMATGVSLRSQNGGAIDPYKAALQTPAVPMAQSLVKNVLPVIAKYRPQEADNFLANVALYEHRQKQQAEADSVEPEVRTVIDPATGKSLTLYRTGRNSWARRPDTLSEPRATNITNPVSGEPVPMVQTGPNSFSRIPLSAGQQQLEKTEIASGDIFEKGRRLLPLINDKTTGVRGGLQRLLVDSRLGLLFPQAIDPSVSEADAVAREFAASIVHGLRSDGNINEKEWQGLTEEANTLKWVDERTGKSRLKAFVQGAVQKARNASTRLGRPINEKYLTADEIGKRAEAKVEAGEMSREQALQWATQVYNNSAEAFIHDIEKQVNK